jgi:hypothetical protein
MRTKQLTTRATFGVICATWILGSLTGCTVTAREDDDESSSASSGAGGGGGGTTTTGLPVLGNGQHSVDAVNLSVIADPGMQLSVPRDLQFNPLVPNELWIASRATNSISVAMNPGSPDMTTYAPVGMFGSQHFLAQPSALAIGDNGFFASIHETDDKTQGINGTPADFMGPTLWTSNITEFEGGHASHYDMLHNSPNGMGIAWQHDNVYWVFDGYHAAITMYDFQGDHGPAGEDHTDGIVRRYVEGEVAWVENIPSHMEFHPLDGNLLLVADTGNNRIAVLDTTTGTQGVSIFPNYDGSDQKYVDGATMWTLIEGSEVGLTLPSGLTVHDNVIYVTDAGNSVIWGFSLEGALIDYLETGLPSGALSGITFDAQGHIYATDAVSNQVIKVTPLEQQ